MFAFDVVFGACLVRFVRCCVRVALKGPGSVRVRVRREATQNLLCSCSLFEAPVERVFCFFRRSLEHLFVFGERCSSTVLSPPLINTKMVA